MERLKERLEIARKALATLKESLLLENPSDLERDGAIQRFEYTFEACWKACQRYLEAIEGMACASPKSCLRTAGETGLLTEAETVLALAMSDDRNLTSHTYNESVARRLHGNLGAYAALMDQLLNKMAEKADL